jgi:Cdc6-like AAA superfamily ATPase
MKVHLQHWNQKSLLWKITDFNNFWAGQYILADNLEARERFLKHHTHQIDTILKGYPVGSSVFLSYLKQRFITFEEYILLVDKRTFPKSNENHSVFAPLYWSLINKPAYKLLLASSDDHEKNYLALLKRWLPKTSEFFFSPEPVPFPIHALKRHLLITGRTGSGKTQFLQTLFYQLQLHSNQKQQASMILLDPHGDISEKLFSLRLNIQNPSRIWYIDPQLDSNKVPCLNPFWEKIKDPILVDLLSQQWAKAFSELIPEAGMSLQMEAVLKPCLAVLFQTGECGLLDLQNFMDDSQNEKLVALGRQSLHPVFRGFFESAFLNKKYAPTKLAIYTRLQLLLNNYSFYQMMNGKSSIDLKKAMAQGKIILFNLSKGKLGEDTSRALGRFISATLLSIALQRAFESEGNRKSCYLFVDEFHNMASNSMETVFSEARKYHLHMIVGTQTIGQLPLSLKDMVLNNTAVKLVGLNGLPALKSQASDIGVSFADLQNLPPYHFYLKYDHYPALKIKSSDFMLKHPKRYFATEKEIAFLKDFVLEKSGLYRDNTLDFSTTVSKVVSKSKTANELLSSNNDSNENFTPEFEL